MTDFAPEGGLRNALVNDIRNEVAECMVGEEKEIWKETFLKGGFAAPNSYYKIMTVNGRNEDDKRKHSIMRRNNRVF